MKKKIGALALGTLVTILLDLFLGRVLQVELLWKIAISVFLGALTSGAMAQTSGYLFGLLVGTINGCITAGIFLVLAPSLPPTGSEARLLYVGVPIIVSLVSGILGGTVGMFLVRKFNLSGRSSAV